MARLNAPVTDAFIFPAAPPSNTTVMRSANAAPSTANPSATFEAACQGSAVQVPFKIEMESAFGQSFDGVSAYVGRQAELDSLGAEGAAVGESIAFADSAPSKHVVAHELTHVVQARQGGAATTQQPQLRGRLSQPTDIAEIEAEHVAARVTSGQSAGAIGATAQGAVFLRRTLTLRQMPPAQNWSTAKFSETLPEKPTPMSHGGITELANATFADRGNSVVPCSPANAAKIADMHARADHARTAYVADYYSAHRSMTDLAGTWASFDDPEKDPTLKSVFVLESGRNLEEQLGSQVAFAKDKTPLSNSETNKLREMAADPKIADLQKEVAKSDERVAESESLCKAAAEGVKGQSDELLSRVAALKVLEAEDDKTEAESNLKQVEAKRAELTAALGLLINASVGFMPPVSAAVTGPGGARRATAMTSAGLLTSTLYSNRMAAAKKRVDRAVSELRRVRGLQATLAIDAAQRELTKKFHQLKAAQAATRAALIDRRQKYDRLSQAMIEAGGDENESETHRLSGMVRAIPKVEALVNAFRSLRDTAGKQPVYSAPSGGGHAIAKKFGFDLVAYAFMWNLAQLRHHYKVSAQKEALWDGRLESCRSALGNLRT